MLVFQIQLLREGVVSGLSDRAAYPRHRVRRGPPEHLRNLIDPGVELVILDGVPDEAPLRSLIRRDPASEHRDTASTRCPHSEREMPRRAEVGDDAESGPEGGDEER